MRLDRLDGSPTQTNYSMQLFDHAGAQGPNKEIVVNCPITPLYVGVWVQAVTHPKGLDEQSNLPVDSPALTVCKNCPPREERKA